MRNIGLVGFMGTGKTVIGKALASRLGLQFFDSDQFIEKMTGKSITAIFEQDGEQQFRRLEETAVERLSRLRAVVSYGGGVVLSPVNRERLKNRSFIILLRATPATILRRLREDQTRPLLYCRKTIDQIAAMINERHPFYESMNDYCIDTDGRAIDEIVEEIIGMVK
ncbi:MAG: shikimate kinase [Candidatus Thorarchaeota archaeon]